MPESRIFRFLRASRMITEAIFYRSGIQLRMPDMAFDSFSESGIIHLSDCISQMSNGEEPPASYGKMFGDFPGQHGIEKI